MTQTDTPTWPPAEAAFELTGHCACCGADTRSLFAMGHDARFKGVLARTLAAASDWTATVPWFTGASAAELVTVEQALERVAALLDRDWTEKIESSASRIAKTNVGRSVRAAVVASRVALRKSDGPDEPQQPFVPRETSDEYVERLMSRLREHPLVGEWGWYRPNGGHDRFAARVQHTNRRDGSALVSLYVPALVPGQPQVVDGVDPSREWVRDEDAKT